MAGQFQLPTLFCTKCNGELPRALWNAERLSPCPTCSSHIYVFAFPSLLEGVDYGRAGETLLVAGDAGCFYHPQKKAELACEYCGRFLCALCDVELNGKHLCPPCIESGKKKGKLKSLENRRVLYDSIALSLAVLPLLVFYFTIITAPVSLFLAIRYWNAPSSLLHRTKIRLVLAVLFSVFQIVGWVVLVYFLLNR